METGSDAVRTSTNLQIAHAHRPSRTITHQGTQVRERESPKRLGACACARTGLARPNSMPNATLERTPHNQLCLYGVAHHTH